MEEEVFYDIFGYMFKKKETLDVALITWKKYGGNQRKLIVISKFWLGFWICGKLVHPFVHLPMGTKRPKQTCLPNEKTFQKICMSPWKAKKKNAYHMKGKERKHVNHLKGIK